MPSESLQGRLLIASPSLVDPNFRRTVVLITVHGDEGAMGIVHNRPAPAPVAEAVPHLEHLVPDGDAVFVGGPVQPEAVTALAEVSDTELGEEQHVEGGFADGAAVLRYLRDGRLVAALLTGQSEEAEAELKEEIRQQAVATA